MIVCTVPRETNASPPFARTRSATASMSATVASGVITTTMRSNLLVLPGRTVRRSRNPGRPARGRSLLGGRWRLGRVVPAVEEPEADVLLHLWQMVADGGRGWQATRAHRRSMR